MRKSVAKLATNVYTRRKIETNRAVLTRFGYTAGPSTIQFAPVYVERTQCLHKETSKACARQTADSATTTWHIIIGQYQKSSISEYSNIRGLFGTNIRSQILVFVPALLFTHCRTACGPEARQTEAEWGVVWQDNSLQLNNHITSIIGDRHLPSDVYVHRLLTELQRHHAPTARAPLSC